MKKITILLVAFLFNANFSQLSAQDITEGMVKMEITEVSSDNPQVAAQLEMMKGTSTEYYFSPDKSLVSSNMMGGMIKMSYLVDNNTENMTMLFDAMGQKMMVESTKDERKEMEEQQNATAEQVDITYDEKDTKEILGYKCIKATITPKENADVPMTFGMYVSEDVMASNKLIQGLQAFNLKGFPLEMIMEMPEMKLTFTTTELKDSIDKSVFDVKTSGYTKMTFDEFSQTMGGMGGGMGF